MPVEQLMQSMQPEKELQTNDMSSGGYGGGGGSSGASGTASASPQ
jgi:hypothetical protein